MSLFKPAAKPTAKASVPTVVPVPRKRRKYNPARMAEPTLRELNMHLAMFRYDAGSLEEGQIQVTDALHLPANKITWLNIEGMNRKQVEALANHFRLHPLLVDDILNVGQRAKMDEIGDTVFCILPMLYYNEATGQVETEQASLALVSGGVLSFQEEPERDVFDAVRTRLRTQGSKLRSSGPDFLLYSLIDVIVDSYFGILERLDQRTEVLENEILRDNRGATSTKIALLRRELMATIRAITPVREVVNGILRSDSPLRNENNEKYYKDVLDHIFHALDTAESLRDATATLQELSFNQVNLRTNEVVKVFTIITTLLAPATVIGGIFGMNFDVIPLSHQKDGFFLMVALMLLIPVFMLMWFKRKGWF